MLYLDSSALVKLVIPEPESDQLQQRLEGSDVNLSSIIAAIEVPRAVNRVTGGAAALQRVEEVLSGLDLRELDREVVAAARSVSPTVRSLDAIHLATALTLSDEIEAVVAYDQRLAKAARRAGFEVTAPGA